MKLKGHFSKVQNLRPYAKKQIPKKVRKYFMSDEEFLTIWELFNNIKTEEDKVFWINLIETSKTYKHYKKSPISFYMDNLHDDNTAEKVLDFCKEREAYAFNILASSNAIMEWLFTRTVHTSSLEVVSFSK
jgi:hypothetical protein